MNKNNYVDGKGAILKKAFYTLAVVWLALSVIGSLVAAIVFKANSNVITDPEKPIGGICLFLCVIEIGIACAHQCRNSHLLLALVMLAMIPAFCMVLALSGCDISIGILFFIFANPLATIFSIIVFGLNAIIGLFKPNSRKFIYWIIGLLTLQKVGAPIIMYITHHKLLAIIAIVVVVMVLLAIFSPDTSSSTAGWDSGASRKPSRTANADHSYSVSSYGSYSNSSGGNYDRDIESLEKEIRKLENDISNKMNEIKKHEEMIDMINRKAAGALGQDVKGQQTAISRLQNDIKISKGMIEEKEN